MSTGKRSDRKAGFCREDGGGGNRTRERFQPPFEIPAAVVAYLSALLLLATQARWAGV